MKGNNKMLEVYEILTQSNIYLIKHYFDLRYAM